MKRHRCYRAVMVRTQIQLTEEQARAVVRESLETRQRQRNAIDREELKRRALSVAGCFRSGVSDLGEHQDRYASDSFTQ